MYLVRDFTERAVSGTSGRGKTFMLTEFSLAPTLSGKRPLPHDVIEATIIRMIPD
jgi:hypothetical protein